MCSVVAFQSSNKIVFVSFFPKGTSDNLVFSCHYDTHYRI